MSHFPAIAIVGLGALFPGSSDVGGFWNDVFWGRDRISEVPPTHWLPEDYYDPDPSAPDKVYCKRGAFLSPTQFDPIAFGIPPQTLSATDTSQLLALVVAKQVLDDAARGPFQPLDRDRISVILGVIGGQKLMAEMAGRLQRPVVLKALRESGIPENQAQAICERIGEHYPAMQESTFPGLLGNVVAGRIANRFDLGGTNFVTDAACASSLSAVRMAIQELALGSSDLVITGGVDTSNDIATFFSFCKTPALSFTGDCRPYSEDADGTLLGEGLAMLALRRLEDAERDGNRIYAVIRGVGTSSDGKALSIYAPRASGQAKAVQKAYESAGYSPATVELVEGHGTGTRSGDEAEVQALNEVFRTPGRRKWCALGSIKSMLGHTKSAAGAAGLMKVALSLHQGVLPPTLKVKAPASFLLQEDSPFYLSPHARPWIRGHAHPRRASVSAFGFGGTNFHMTVEEYRGPGARPKKLRALKSELFLFSASSAAELLAECQETFEQEKFQTKARNSQLGFKPDAPYRLAVVADDAESLNDKLAQARQQLQAEPDDSFSWPGVHYQSGLAMGPVAFLFPGQGSQYVGMGAGVAMAFEDARSVWDAAADLDMDGAKSLHEAVFPPPGFTQEERESQADMLRQTEWAQPAIGAMSLSLLRLLQRIGLEPACVGGHSFGEIVALAAAGVLEPMDALRIARRRGELMARASETPGSMLAVQASRETLAPLLLEWDLPVVLANDNSTSQVALAGPSDAIWEVEERLKIEGIVSKRLFVSTAFHSPLVAPACVPFLEALESVTFASPRVPAYSNLTAGTYPAEPPRAWLADQIVQPVRFREMIEAMYARGARIFLEVGPGSVLTSLVADTLHGRSYATIPMDIRGRDGVTSLWNALGELSVRGVSLDFAPMWEEFELAAEPEAIAFSMLISGANHGKLYPPSEGAAALPKPNPERLADPGQDAVVKAIAEGHSAYLKAMEAALVQTHRTFLETMAGALPEGTAFPELEGLSLQASMPTTAPRPTTPPASQPVETAVPEGDLRSQLMAIVSERTGYPMAALGLHMDLEADLGIDSIKRIEILVAAQQRFPWLPDVSDGAVAGFRTLAEIASFLEGRAPEEAIAPAPIFRGVVRAVPAPPLKELNWNHLQSPVVVTDEGRGIAQALVNLLLSNGIEADIGRDFSQAGTAVVLDGLREVPDAETAILINKDAFRLAQSFVGIATSGVWMTVQDTGGDFGLGGTAPARAYLAGLAALTKTLAQECPKVAAKALDLDTAGRTPEEIAELLLAELTQPADLLEVGYMADGSRWTLDVVQQPLEAVESGLDESSVLVVTGGARGITATSLLALAKARRPRLALLGRSQLTPEPEGLGAFQDEAALTGALYETPLAQGLTPVQVAERARQILAVREVRATIAELQHAGSEVVYLSVDVRDHEEVREALAQVRQLWGPISGIVHGAGILADKRIAEKTPEQFDRVFDTKVMGLRSLLAATQDDPLDLLVLFSSVAARTGNPGQSDYAMANEILNRVAAAEAKQRPDCRVRAIGWGPWEAGMVSPELKKRFEAMKIPLIAPEQGAKAFLDELEAGGPMEVIRGGTLLEQDHAPESPHASGIAVVINRESDPTIDDHRIRGIPVVPVVSMIERFVKTARALNPDWQHVAVHNLRVLKGIRLSDFEGAGDRFTLIPTQRDGGLELTLRGEGGNLHYQAFVTPSDAVARPWEAFGGLEPLPWPYEALYRDLMFHGPAFQPLLSVAGTSKEGIIGTLADSRDLDWPEGPQFVDQPLLDGGLQLAGLWGRVALGDLAADGQLGIPTQVEKYIQYQRGLAPGPSRAIVRTRVGEGKRSVSDIQFVSQDGRVWAEMLGVEMYLVETKQATPHA